MADIPDYMRGFDLDNDWGFTPVSTPPTTEEKPTIDPKTIDNQSLELAKVKTTVSDIKSMMNEIMQIVDDKETITKEVNEWFIGCSNKLWTGYETLEYFWASLVIFEFY